MTEGAMGGGENWGRVGAERNPEREKVVAEMELTSGTLGRCLGVVRRFFGNFCGQCHTIYGQGGRVGRTSLPTADPLSSSYCRTYSIPAWSSLRLTGDNGGQARWQNLTGLVKEQKRASHRFNTAGRRRGKRAAEPCAIYPPEQTFHDARGNRDVARKERLVRSVCVSVP